MKFQPVDVTIPEPIEKIIQQIKDIEPNTCLAGGCLSDLYMNRPFKDVDIFILYSADAYASILKHFNLSHMSIYSDSSQEHYFKERLVTVTSFEYNGYTVQLIFTSLGASIVNHFDFRFREFYYDGIQTFATNEALEDIANKQLVFGVTDNPLGSCRRLIAFEKKYSDFTIEPDSFHRLQSFFNQHVYSKERVESIMKTKDTQTEQALCSILSRKKFIQKFDLRHPRYQKFANYCLFHHFTRSQTDLLYAKNDFYYEKITHTFTEHFFDTQTNKIHQHFKDVFDKNRLRLVGVLSPPDLKKLKQALENINAVDIYYVLSKYEFSESLYSFVDHFNNGFEQLNELNTFNKSDQFSMDFSAQISNDVVLHTHMNLDDYLHNRFVKCNINSTGSKTSSDLIFNHETGEILYYRFYKPLSLLYQQIIQDKYFSDKEDIFNDLFSEFSY